MTIQEMLSYRYCNGTKFKVFGDENIHTLATLDFNTGECMSFENRRLYGIKEVEKFIFPAALSSQNK